MSTKCDCLNYCGDDPDLMNGKCSPCETYKNRISRPKSENIATLLGIHASQLESNPHCYFELAYTRTTGWMTFICDKPAVGTVGTPEFGMGRKIITNGQGGTADEACAAALAAIGAPA